MKEDHHSYRRNFGSCELKKIQACTRFEPLTFAIPVQLRIPYKPEFFSGFLFATAKFASITVMIFFHLILHPAVLIYFFHIFII